MKECRCGLRLISIFDLARGTCFFCDLKTIETAGYKSFVFDRVPPIPKETKTCGFCSEPCGNEWCCMNKEEK